MLGQSDLRISICWWVEHGILKKMGVKKMGLKIQKLEVTVLDTVLGTTGMEDIRQRK